MNRASVFILIGALFVNGAARKAGAQQPLATAPDTLRLPALVAEALRADARQGQMALQAHATSLRLQSIAAERLPTLASTGYAQYASRVVTIPVRIPGVSAPVPPNDSYDAHVDATEPLLDLTRGPRRVVERAQLAENQAAVQVSLFSLRGEVQGAFFTIAADAQRAANVDATILDLQGRLAEARDRFRAGAALPGDTATLAASLYQRRQDALQLRADERAARTRLSQLIGRRIGESAVLTLADDDLAAAVSTARAALTSGSDPHARPEFAQFAAARARLAAQEAVIKSTTQLQLTAFTHAGIGRPGLDIFSHAFQGYWIAGVNFHWAPFSWGTNQRQREELEIEREIIATDESSFNERLQRNIQTDLATIDRLSPTLALDDSIVALREIVVREARAQLNEGALTAAAYLDRTTDLLSARLTRTEHRVTLAQARVNLLNTLGLDLSTTR